MLTVWVGQRRAGILWRNRFGQIGFRYDSTWLAEGGFAISRSLPLRGDDFVAEEAVAHRYFANLLPEGTTRDRVVRGLSIPNTEFDLLQAIGGECAGALSVLPEGRRPAKRHEYRPLTDEDIEGLVRRRGWIDSAWSAGGHLRLSLAGAQHKCPVLVRDDLYLLPLDEAPSTHILKFELADYRHVPAYETYTTFLAGAAGLPVVDIELRTAGRSHYVLIGRYDRIAENDGNVTRLHQEDFCQALGYGHEQKYQDHDGPSFAQCFRLVQDASSEPAMDAGHLLRWQVFNVLAGNSDGHAKNLSLLHHGDRHTRLAPFYDLICTRAIRGIDSRLAFDVGGMRDPGMVTAAHWDVLARQCDVQPRFLRRLVRDTARALLDNLEGAREQFAGRFGACPALQRIDRVVARQCRRFADA